MDTPPQVRHRGQEVLGDGSGLTHWRRDTELRPTRSRVLKTTKQQTQVKTLSVGQEDA